MIESFHGEQAWNVFMKNDIEEGGTINYLEPTHEPGSYITLEALDDLICALSACPQDQTLTNGPECAEMEVRIWEPTGPDRFVKVSARNRLPSRIHFTFQEA